MATGVVQYNSELKRKQWMREGLIQASSKSFWSAYTGMTKDNVVFQVNNENSSEGHTVVFDFDGNLSGRAIKGKETAYGKGEQKRKFSDKITVERYRLVVDNGDKFDGVDIGDLNINQHSDSRSKLADLFTRFKDQALFDTAQGFKDGATPTHVYTVDASSTALAYKDLVDLEKALRTGTGFKSVGFNAAGAAAGQRAPLEPYRLADGRSIWVLVIDPFTAANIKGNTAAGGIMSLAQHADLRGSNNRIFRGLLGQIGQLVIVEAEAFFGATYGNGLDDSEIEIAGMRQFDGTKWAGEEGYTGALWSRNLILGAGAMQMAFGKQPDYKYQPSQDFGIKSESAVEFWMETKKTKMTAENRDYKAAKRAELDHGVIAFDVKLA
jgi:hypothetical protein